MDEKKLKRHTCLIMTLYIWTNIYLDKQNEVNTENISRAYIFLKQEPALEAQQKTNGGDANEIIYNQD